MSRTDYRVKDYLDRCKSALDGLLNTHAQLTREYGYLQKELEQGSPAVQTKTEAAPAGQKADAVGSETLDGLLGQAQELLAQRMVEFLRTPCKDHGFEFDLYDLNTVDYGLATISGIGELRGRFKEGGDF